MTSPTSPERYGAYFGDSWEAPVNEGARQLPTPVGERCVLCEVSIVEGDRGVFAIVPAAAISGQPDLRRS